VGAVAGGARRVIGQARPAFLKKRSKKLLISGLLPFRIERGQTGKSFLVLFFKKEHA
jgi:hypothetical protein